MALKQERLDTIKLIVSSQEIGNQEELLCALANEGFTLTQATLSRDLRQLKVTKALSVSGKSVYVLPNNTMYKRVREHKSIKEMRMNSGFISIRFSLNIGVIRTRPGYASSLAYDIDNANIPQIIGTIAGDDTIMLVTDEVSSRESVLQALSAVLPIE